MSSTLWPVCCLWIIGLGENRTPPGDPRGRRRPERVLAELLDGNFQAGGLPVQKGAGPRRADGVHGEIAHDPVFEEYDLGVLAADLQDGSDLRDELFGGRRVGGDLVLHDIGARDDGGKLPGAAGGSGAHDG
ncbi:hypothetical protein SDC9_203952 [bioreactor metagenome]|uniref:Uncharacterized protein n=1 Tax=bioreactor metagenome TaxID=1076179 RepID=A0A645IYJ5_9ZZZZ